VAELCGRGELGFGAALAWRMGRSRGAAAVKKGRAEDLGEACRGGCGRDPRRDHWLLLARGGRRGEDTDEWGLAASEMGGHGAERRPGKAGTGRARELGRALVAGPARDSTGLAKKGKGERVTRLGCWAGLGWRAG
jgi:hypothetical protein